MKARVEVTITKVLDVEVADDCLTPEALAEFGRAIFEVDGPAGLLRHAARQVAAHSSIRFVEGIGQADHEVFAKEHTKVRWSEVSEEIESKEVTC